MSSQMRETFGNKVFQVLVAHVYLCISAVDGCVFVLKLATDLREAEEFWRCMLDISSVDFSVGKLLQATGKIVNGFLFRGETVDAIAKFCTLDVKLVWPNLVEDCHSPPGRSRR
jgi:hypothetical protein